MTSGLIRRCRIQAHYSRCSCPAIQRNWSLTQLASVLIIPKMTMRNVLDNCEHSGLAAPLQRVVTSWLSSCLLFLTLSISGTAIADDSKGDEILSAIVGVHAEVPITARTAAALGTERQGSGVVIGADGLILTIGYLILEASRVEVTFADGETVPVNIVAYDHNTGFGLLRTVHPIDTTPMKLGRSADVEESAQLLISG